MAAINKLYLDLSNKNLIKDEYLKLANNNEAVRVAVDQ